MNVMKLSAALCGLAAVKVSQAAPLNPQPLPPGFAIDVHEPKVEKRAPFNPQPQPPVRIGETRLVKPRQDEFCDGNEVVYTQDGSAICTPILPDIIDTFGEIDS